MDKDSSENEIFECVRRGDKTTLAQLLEKDISLLNKQHNQTGMTITMLAAKSGLLHMTRYLISFKEINLEIRDLNGHRALEHSIPFKSVFSEIARKMYSKPPDKTFGALGL